MSCSHFVTGRFCLDDEKKCCKQQVCVMQHVFGVLHSHICCMTCFMQHVSPCKYTIIYIFHFSLFHCWRSPSSSVVKRWPTDLVVPSSSLAQGKIFSTINRAPLHTAFHYHPPIIQIWLKYCWKDVKSLVIRPSISFLACLDEVQEELLYYPRRWWRRRH